MYTVDLSGTAFHELCKEWKRLSPNHQAYSNWAPTKIIEWYEFFCATKQRLIFRVRRERLSGSLEVTIDVVRCRFGLREIPLYPREFYEKLCALVKNKDHRRGMGVLAKHEDLIMEQWRDFIGLCVVPDRGMLGDTENYDE